MFVQIDHAKLELLPERQGKVELRDYPHFHQNFAKALALALLLFCQRAIHGGFGGEAHLDQDLANAKLSTGLKTHGTGYVVSVEFSGLMREAPDDCAVPFREVWMLTRFMHGAEGWKLARHQALI